MQHEGRAVPSYGNDWGFEIPHSHFCRSGGIGKRISSNRNGLSMKMFRRIGRSLIAFGVRISGPALISNVSLCSDRRNWKIHRV